MEKFPRILNPGLDLSILYSTVPTYLPNLRLAYGVSNLPFQTSKRKKKEKEKKEKMIVMMIMIIRRRGGKRKGYSVYV